MKQSMRIACAICSESFQLATLEHKWWLVPYTAAPHDLTQFFADHAPCAQVSPVPPSGPFTMVYE